MSNIKEQIRQEIERLKGICTAQIKANPGQTFPFVMEMTGYDKLLSFIDSLPEEKPSENLEEAAEEYALLFNDGTKWKDGGKYKGFIAGAEWMAKQGVTFTAAVDHYEDFYLDSCDQEAEAIKKLGLKVMDWAIVQIRKK